MKIRKGYLFKRGKTFYACWFVGGKKFVKTTGQSDRRDADKVLAEIMQPFLIEDEARTLENVKARIEGAKAELEQIKNERNPPLSIARAWGEYLASPNRPDSGENTLAQYAMQFGVFSRWVEANHPNVTALKDVSPSIVAGFAAFLANRSPNTYNKYLNLLTLVFRVLKDKAQLTTNPWEAIQRKRLVTHSRRELTTDEVRKVCQTATGDLRLLFAIGIYTGLRLGDCATLRWGEVDLQRGRITRIPNKTAYKQKPVMVPIHPTLNRMLTETAPPARAGYVLPHLATMYIQNRANVCDLVQKHILKCGIATTRQGPRGRAVIDVGFHSLRHTFVSLCREAGAPLSIVEAIVGHSNPAMTRHYTHVSELAAGQAVNALPAVVGTAAHKLLPPPRMVDSAPILEIAQELNAKNWRATKERLLAVLAP